MEPITWIAIAMLVSSIAISIATANKAEKPKVAGLDDMNIPQVDEGTPQAVFFGDCWTGDWMVLWTGNLRTTKIKSKSGKAGIKKFAKKTLKVTKIITAWMVVDYTNFVKSKLNR